MAWLTIGRTYHFSLCVSHIVIIFCPLSSSFIIVMQEISKIWNRGMSDSDRQYYTEFANDARTEYLNQQIEFRATGSYTPSTEFSKYEGVNVWVRAVWHLKCGLEREIISYASVPFPKRPADAEESYEWRAEVSKVRRKLKLKNFLNADGTLKEGAAAIEYLEQQGASEYLEVFQNLEVFQKRGWKGGHSGGDDDKEEDDEVSMQEESLDEEQVDESEVDELVEL